VIPVFVIPAFAQAPARSISNEDKAAFEAIIKDYLMKNPAVVRDAMDLLRAQEAAAAAEKTKKTLADEHKNLIADPESPWIGSANPDVTIVEFFDYHCGFCKQISPSLVKLVESDAKVRVVFKNFPILGAESVYAAKVSLAARKSPKFAALHNAMIAGSVFNPETVKKMAADAGVDPAIFGAVDSPEITALVDKNAKLATALGVNSTPSLVVGDKVMAGAVSFESLTALVAAERAQAAAQQAPKPQAGQ
jgi:protein-disulfide isomerase